jgi:O-acetyl-ADP-ribose deacetylase (regulator of RNase III)
VIQVRIDDLAFVQADALAWPVTAELRATTPLLRRLEQYGGAALASQLAVREPLPVGSAVVTGAGDLAVGLLVNAVVSSDSEPVSAGTVRRALTSSLQRAADWRIESLALTPFGLGAGNLDLEDSAAMTMEVLGEHLVRARHPASVTIVVESALEEAVFSSFLARVRA